MFVVRGPVGEPADAPPGEVNVRRAESADDLALVERIVIDGYPMPELDWLPANRAMGPALLGSAVRHWIGYLDGTPTGAAASHAAHGVLNLCLAATLPAARRRGVWRALLAARCAGTPDLPAVAFTSDYSRPGFVRAGFLPITRFTLWAVAA
jgi:GNAT superfamily N-acetyltransferase